MEKVEIKLTKVEKTALDYIWNRAVKGPIDEGVLEVLGWENQEDFLADVFRHGMDDVSERLLEFIGVQVYEKSLILSKNVGESQVKGGDS